MIQAHRRGRPAELERTAATREPDRRAMAMSAQSLIAEQPKPTVPPRLRLPPNCVDVTPERVATITAITGVTAAGKGTKPG